MFYFGCQECSVPRDSPADGFPCGCAGKRAPSDSGTAISHKQQKQRLRDALGVTSLAVVLIAEDGY